jgi:hypothetical protein
MGQRRNAVVTRDSAGEQDMRDQEVLRANKELAAYFRGERTEREARAALKIIKAFVRDRQRMDAKGRPPLPGAKATQTPNAIANRRAASDRDQRHLSKRPRTSIDMQSKAMTASAERPLNPEPPQPSASDDRTDE